MATLAELYASAAVDFDVPFETFLDQTKEAYGRAIAYQKEHGG
jgi:hypothetical protein